MNDGSLLRSLSQKYAKIFAIDEIAESLRLRAVFVVVWFLAVWDLRYYATSPHQFVDPQHPYQINCWPYFDRCVQAYHFAALPDSYAYTLWMAVVMGLLLVSVVGLLWKREVLAHAALSLVIVWEFVFHFILVDYQTTTTDLLYLVPAATLLFTRHKLSNLRFIWALLCLLLARTQINDGWILGTYFTSTSLGAPLVPLLLAPVLTQVVLFSEIFFAWGLLSSKGKWRQVSFWVLTVCFLFTAIYLGYFLPVICLSFLWTLFAAPDLDPRSDFFFRASKRFVLLIVALCFGCFYFIFIPGDSEYTFQGVEYGLYSLSTNYQCAGQIEHFDASGKSLQKWIKRTKRPYVRCYPESYFQYLRELCRTYAPGDRLKWSMAISKNGGPFYEIINTENACALEYKAFSANDWIRSPGPETHIAGYPQKNSFYDFGNTTGRVVLDPTPEESAFTYPWLRNNLEIILWIYRTFWIALFVSSFYILFRGKQRPRRDHESV